MSRQGNSQQLDTATKPEPSCQKHDDRSTRARQPQPLQCALPSLEGPRKFDGPDIEPEDIPRLSGQLERVFELMRDGRKRTLREISDAVGCSEASASARLRDCRKAMAGKHQVHRERHPSKPGLWLYRLEVRQ